MELGETVGTQLRVPRMEDNFWLRLKERLSKEIWRVIKDELLEPVRREERYLLRATIIAASSTQEGGYDGVR